MGVSVHLRHIIEILTMNITTLTTCDQDKFKDFIVIDESSINSNEFVTFGRLLLKSTNQNENKDSKKSSPKSKIRYRLSGKYDFENLKYGSEESCQNNDDDGETILLKDENSNERTVELIENQEYLKEF